MGMLMHHTWQEQQKNAKGQKQENPALVEEKAEPVSEPVKEPVKRATRRKTK